MRRREFLAAAAAAPALAPAASTVPQNSWPKTMGGLTCLGAQLAQ